jgi:hypothetical protein
MTPKARIIATLTLPLALFCTAPQADEVTDQLDMARKAYDSGELRSAIQALNFATAGIQQRMNDQVLKLLPEPLTGWQADAAQAESGGIAAMVAGTILSRTYRRPDGAQGELRLMADSPMMAMMAMMMQSPMLMQSSRDTRVYTNRGHQGMIQHEAGSDEWEISLMVGPRIMVQVKGQGLADQKPVEEYLNALDLSAVQKALTN